MQSCGVRKKNKGEQVVKQGGRKQRAVCEHGMGKMRGFLAILLGNGRGWIRTKLFFGRNQGRWAKNLIKSVTNHPHSAGFKTPPRAQLCGENRTRKTKNRSIETGKNNSVVPTKTIDKNPQNHLDKSSPFHSKPLQIDSPLSIPSLSITLTQSPISNITLQTLYNDPEQMGVKASFVFGGQKPQRTRAMYVEILATHSDGLSA